MGIPVLGKILPILGILPTPTNVAQTKELYKAVHKRILQKKCVVIYPEAHVWPYYTKIRPFDETAFKFPVDCDCASFSITTTYYKRKNKKKPGIKIYIDGPFLPDSKLNKKEKQNKLYKEIYNCMNDRSNNSNYEYIKYERID